MAASFIQIPADGTGKKVRTFERTVGADNVHEHFYQLISPATGNAIEPATETTLTDILSDLDILADWNEGSRTKVNLIVGQAGIAAGTGVDGATVQRVTLATDIGLPAGTNTLGTIKGQRITAGTDGAVTVSTSAVLILSSDSTRGSWVITNNGPGTLYVGIDNLVTTSGATMGNKVLPNGSIGDGGDGAYMGTVYGIYSEAAASQNVSYMTSTTSP